MAEVLTKQLPQNWRGRVRSIIGDAFGANIVEDTIEKAVKFAREKADAPETIFESPEHLFMGQKFVSHNNRMEPEDLRAVAKSPIVAAVIKTRINQLAQFCVPRVGPYQIGYEITEKNQRRTDGVETPNQELADFVYNCGLEGYGDRSLEAFCRKFMRDSLVLDQACAEIVARRNGEPAYWMAVDSGTICRLKASLTPVIKDPNEPQFVQIVDGKQVAVYTDRQMMFGVRNPSTDIRTNGYGCSELEELIRVVTTMINVERYNSSQLRQGGTSKGILVVKSEIQDDQYASFRREFQSAITNAADNWRPPLLRVGKDAEINWVKLDTSNREQEYAKLLDFLIKQTCAVYQIDPMEINWNDENNPRRLYEGVKGVQYSQSQRRGLRTLLKFMANILNYKVIKYLGEGYKIEFLGLDENEERDAERIQKEVSTYKTLNEIRQERGLGPIDGGDVVLSPELIANRTLESGADESMSKSLLFRRMVGRDPAGMGINDDGV